MLMLIALQLGGPRGIEARGVRGGAYRRGPLLSPFLDPGLHQSLPGLTL